MSLVETQINLSLLPSKDSLYTALFRHQPATYILSNNTNELIGRRKKGGSMIAVKGEVSKHATATGADPTCLGRWNYVDVVNRANKVRFISACQCIKSKTTLGTVHLQRRRLYLARKIDVCPRKLFSLHLTQFIAESISS